MDARRIAAILAATGAGLWLSQALLLVVRSGVTPNAQIEAVTFGVGFAAFMTAAGLVGWGATATRRPAARAVLVVLSALAVPLAVVFGQVALFALPGSHWLESDAVVIVIAAAGLVWGIKELRRRE
jgi:peptidoglycan/LPS O-acetylase OafA/YrhL